MNKIWPLALFLSACVPAAAPTKPSTQTSQKTTVWSSFSAQGVVYSNEKGACVARWPAMVPQCPALGGPAGAVAWQNEKAWVYLPTQGQTVTLDGPPQNLFVGQAVALGSEGAYLANGDLMNWQGQSVQRFSRPPRSMVSAGEWGDVLLTENTLQHWKKGALVESLPASAGGVPRLVHGATSMNVRQGRFAGFDAFGVVWEQRGDMLFRDNVALSAAQPVLVIGVSGGRVWALLGDKKAAPSTWVLKAF